ncbi:conserved hypothetical protein [Parafrankia sp. EAN1pec]|uniref:hypothetical protein n=1 Tax=Parafrankia sp. (strain EAN1pec) TaxID=298653 RepID=UPI00005403D1|nr:conserved hypothetical protein [Frankia sp. EAN1pec]
MVPLASWDPDQLSLYGWLENQILREYPHLSAVDAATGHSRAAALLHAGLILPVLDGLDEIRVGGRDQALTAINDGLRSNIGLVLSCRAEEFRAAVQSEPDWQPIHLDGAAGIRLTPLTSAVVGDYLLAGSGNNGFTRWEQALTALADPTTSLGQALSTPLAASLARTIYNPRPGEFIRGLPDPSDLTTLPTRQAVEQHLFDGYLPAAYRAHPDQPTRWTASQATRYLVFLAHHLEHRLETTALSWWELSRATPRALSILVYGLTSGLAFGLADRPAVGLALGLVFGLAVGPAVELLIGSASPGRMALRPPRLFDLAVGLTIGVAVGLTDGLMDGLSAGLSTGLPFGLALGLVVGIRLDPTAETRRATDPRTILVQDRASGLAMGLVLGLTVGLTVGFTDNALTAGLPAGLPAGLTATLTFALGSAWGRLGVTRLWLAARRKQPLRLIAFLTDAHDRGVLRQAGAVWEFRHANLQRHLAGPP